MSNLSFRRKEGQSQPDAGEPLNIRAKLVGSDSNTKHDRIKTSLHLLLLVGFLLLWSQLQSSQTQHHTMSNQDADAVRVAASSAKPRKRSPESVIASDQLISSSSQEHDLLVRLGDFVYTRGDWDGAPVVIQEHKLIFFTAAKVGCTTWKQLFRRMMGFEDWKVEEWVYFKPWNPKTNGLRYLYDFDPATASRMLTDPTWTRAIFVRDPKVRFVSAFLDKAVTHHSYINNKCCPETRTCQNRTSARAFLDLAQTCHDAHWAPQHMRMEDKYWETINFVGHMENVASDAERLLRRIGAWEQYGASGWGAHGTDSVFQTSAGGIGRQHATRAQEKLKQYVRPEDEAILDQWYGPDYAHPVMQLDPMHIYTQDEMTTAGVEAESFGTEV